MDITSLITDETILLSLEANDKADCIRQMAGQLQQTGFVADLTAYVEAVEAREETGSTGIGFGVAIPHGKSAGVGRAGLAFARLTKPIDWDSLDGKPVTLVFMIAVPENQAGNEHLQILAALSRKLMHEPFREQLSSAASSAEIIQLLQA
ncbi:fructose PTS transporter subunit IIA [Brevibacillus humidisoli]|uniref:PTS sugar transporter subunit IIA n=1 Tax=Brevibacillus humidisoli TaxID=2895522 RepID=UPI001E5FF3AF|nr:fructose PTS transporter subunit IIA [Brevibacillus humidisoli]UFJ42652.1 fructose PTS transporter subunit IIA [Brevibacillus humidisoli]